MAAPFNNSNNEYFSPINSSNLNTELLKSQYTDSRTDLKRTMSGPPPRTPRPTTGRRLPPPVPTRSRTSDYNRPMYGSPYGNYGSSMFSGSMAPSMYNSPYSYNRHPLSNFVRLAEDSSRPAFESMENIVQAFGSIAMVLESTYNAVQSSFRAVLGLAEHFSRLRVQMTQMLTSFTLFRTIRYLYRKLLVLLRLRAQQSGDNEDLWNEIANVAGPFSGKSGRGQKSSWPLLLFFCIVIGGPYLIWRLMASIKDNTGGDWMAGEGEHFVGVAEYDYEAENDDELSFTTGQEVRIAPKFLQPRLKGWLLASSDGEKSGLIPANYIRVRGKREGKSTGVRKQTAPKGTNCNTVSNYSSAWNSVADDPKVSSHNSDSFVQAVRDNIKPLDGLKSSEKTVLFDDGALEQPPRFDQPRFETESSESERVSPVASGDECVVTDSGIVADKSDKDDITST